MTVTMTLTVISFSAETEIRRELATMVAAVPRLRELLGGDDCERENLEMLVLIIRMLKRLGENVQQRTSH